MSEQPVERYLLMCALAVAVVGAVKDVRGARIPNWLTYSGLGSALAVRGVVLGWVGLKGGFAGLLLAGGIFYVLFLLGGMGGGDVKLMAAVGAWAGVKQAETIPVSYTHLDVYKRQLYAGLGSSRSVELWTRRYAA